MAEFDGQTNGGATTKRQRRPSVRLGDIGGDPPLLQYQWKQQQKVPRGKSSETLDTDCNGGDMDLDRVAVGSWKSKKAKMGGSVRKRARSTWVSPKRADGGGDEEVDRDFRRDNSYEEDERNGTSGNSFDDYDDGGFFSRGEMDGPSDSGERNNGVKSWLNELGLERYAPVFEVHEVDDEVLPMLTLEDLKDMGINAVGTRRKMFSSIQKMNRGLS